MKLTQKLSKEEIKTIKIRSRQLIQRKEATRLRVSKVWLLFLRTFAVIFGFVVLGGVYLYFRSDPNQLPEKFVRILSTFLICLAVSIRGKKWLADFPIDLNKLKEEDTHFSIEDDRKFISKVYRATVLEDYIVLSARKYGTFILKKSTHEKIYEQIKVEFRGKKKNFFTYQYYEE